MIGNVAYVLDLIEELAAVHIFHISLLKKFAGYLAIVVKLKSVTVKDGIYHKDVLENIIDFQVRRLRNKEFSFFKVF